MKKLSVILVSFFFIFFGNARKITGTEDHITNSDSNVRQVVERTTASEMPSDKEPADSRVDANEITNTTPWHQWKVESTTTQIPVAAEGSSRQDTDPNGPTNRGYVGFSRPSIKAGPGSDYTDYSSFEAASPGPVTCVSFASLANGTTVTSQFATQGVQFIDGDDVVTVDAAFVEDGVGLYGNGRIHLEFTRPIYAVGAFFPGGMTIELFDVQGGTSLHTSQDFAGSGSGYFGGTVVPEPGRYVEIRDWVDDSVYLDDVCFAFSGGEDYVDFSSFEAEAGPVACIDFTSLAGGTTVTTQFAAQGVEFPDGDDVVTVNATFVEDGVGLNGNGRVHLEFTRPIYAVGAFFPGGMTIELFDVQGGTSLHTSQDFAGSGSGYFGGTVVPEPGRYVEIRDWVDDSAYLDDVCFAFGDGADYLNYPTFVAASPGTPTCINFTSLADGTVVTTQYGGLAVEFTDGDDSVIADPAFLEDGVGLKGNGRIHLAFGNPVSSIAAFFPGAMTIELFDVQGGNSLYTSQDFGGSGAGHFGGAAINGTSQFVEIRDWADDSVFIDDVCFGATGIFTDGFESGNTMAWSNTIP